MNAVSVLSDDMHAILVSVKPNSPDEHTVGTACRAHPVLRMGFAYEPVPAGLRGDVMGAGGFSVLRMNIGRSKKRDGNRHSSLVPIYFSTSRNALQWTSIFTSHFLSGLALELLHLLDVRRPAP